MNNVNYVKDIKSFSVLANENCEFNKKLEKYSNKIQNLSGMIIDIKPTLTFGDSCVIFSALIIFHDRYNRIEISDLY